MTKRARATSKEKALSEETNNFTHKSSHQNGTQGTKSLTLNSSKHSMISTMAATDEQSENQREEEAVARIVEFREIARSLGLSDEEIRAYLDRSHTSNLATLCCPKFHIYKAYFWTLQRRGLLCSMLASCGENIVEYILKQKMIIILIIAILIGLKRDWLPSPIDGCLIFKTTLTNHLGRPKFPCEICENLTSVPQVTNLTREEFIRLYAFSAVPVLVKGAAAHWKAIDVFSFDYFRSLYENNPGSLAHDEELCQFFRYNTDFQTLTDFIHMAPERAEYRDGQRPWYVGWSICNESLIDIINKEWEMPHFLPEDAIRSYPTWIFIGGTGIGANIHIDDVLDPSWQAQVSGKKTWTLMPGPECSSVCHNLEVTVEKGDIFVIDSNSWYHSTYVHPGEISIALVSEFY